MENKLKSINELVSEEANNAPEFNPYHIDSFHAGAQFATNLTFERVVEALKCFSPTMNERLEMRGVEFGDWLLANRENIIGGKNE